MYKFPSTPHLANLGLNKLRDDKVMTDEERERFLAHSISVEEKIDGANLGISFDADGHFLLQNRGAYLSEPFVWQWKKLPEWLNRHSDTLFDTLSTKYILFGEWCYAVHSIEYNSLPDWFICFDVFDIAECKFLSCRARNLLLESSGLAVINTLSHGKFTLGELISTMNKSYYGDDKAEGLYLRYDDKCCLQARAKLVRPYYMQSIKQHWSKKQILPNRLKQSF